MTLTAVLFVGVFVLMFWGAYRERKQTLWVLLVKNYKIYKIKHFIPCLGGGAFYIWSDEENMMTSNEVVELSGTHVENSTAGLTVRHAVPVYQSIFIPSSDLNFLYIKSLSLFPNTFLLEKIKAGFFVYSIPSLNIYFAYRNIPKKKTDKE